MKLGKEALLAIAVSALFMIGAVFFVLVLIIPSNPVWALVAGILFGLAGAIVWSYPYFVQMFRRSKANTNVDDISQKIQGAEDPENNNYELHRSDSYDNLADDIIAKPQSESKAKSKTKPTPEPDQPVAE